MSGRIPWSRIAPDDIELVIAIMLARRLPDAERIRPSQGDGGIDVLVPVSGTDRIDVYQVKRFADRFGANEKKQVEKSYNRIRKTIATGQIKVRNWYLTLPLDGTREARTWLQGLRRPDSNDPPCKWKGLAFIEGLVADYPEVVDYYLRDGKERLTAAIGDLTRLLHRRQDADGSSVLQPRDVETDLGSIYRSLNSCDPHYRYAFHVDDRPSPIADSPGLVVAQQSVGPGVCITHYVYARYRDAPKDRPINIAVRFEAVPGSQLANEILDFDTYGTALNGSAFVTVDMPGGLGTAGEELGQVKIANVTDPGAGYVRRGQILDSNDATLAEVVLSMEPVTTGISKAGVRFSGQESNGVFSVEMKGKLDNLVSATATFTRLDLTGLRPAAVLPGLRFLRECHAPNQLRFAPEYGLVSHKGSKLAETLAPFDLTDELRIMRALAEIQNYTAEQIFVPDMTRVNRFMVEHWVHAARILKGHTVTLRWSRWEFGLSQDAHREIQSYPDGFQLLMVTDLVITFPEHELKLGKQLVQIAAAQISSEEPAIEREDGRVTVRVVPLAASNQVSHRLATEADLAALSEQRNTEVNGVRVVDVAQSAGD